MHSILVIFTLCLLPSVVITIPRPQFMGKVEKLFKERCAETSQYGLQSATVCRHPGRSINLAHVFSWKYIHDMTLACVTHNPTDFPQLHDLIQRLFAIDPSAVVWIHLGTPPVRHMRHQDYLGDFNKPQLILANRDLFRDAVQMATTLQIKVQGGTPATNDDLKKILNILNSAPANLRYGHASTNQGIRQQIDPMGNQLRRLTVKELGWLHPPHITLAPVTGIHAQCLKCDQQDCRNAVRSSSSSEDTINWYICLR